MLAKSNRFLKVLFYLFELFTIETKKVFGHSPFVLSSTEAGLELELTIMIILKKKLSSNDVTLKNKLQNSQDRNIKSEKKTYALLSMTMNIS